MQLRSVNLAISGLSFFIGLLLAASGIHAVQEVDIVHKIRTYLNTYRVNYTPEKIYVHQDKNLYVAGELIWLKAYVLEASSLRATQKSAVLHLELRNKDQETISKATLPIEDGGAIGDLLLDDSLPSGKYYLTAYTQWMRNFGLVDMFQREIYILGQDSASTSPRIESGVPDLQFFPESGDLMADLEQEVAFKAVGADGRGMPISGVVYDQNGTQVAEFRDLHGGMGGFIFRPKAGQRYFAKINQPEEIAHEYTLPLPKDSGILMRVDESFSEESIRVTLQSSQTPSQNLHLLAIARDNLVQSEAVFLETGKSAEITLLKSEFPTGVAKLTLIDREGVPLAERLLFVDDAENPAFSLTSEKTTYDFREEVKLRILPENPVSESSYDLSLSVVAQDQAAYHPHEENIKTHLLLSSDLKGPVESPNYYFETQSAERSRALRYLMMTQGWRRFEWETIRTQKLPEIRHSNELDLQLWGRLTNEKGDGIERGEALLFLKDRYQAFITAETNPQGYFAFQGFYFRDSIDIVIQGSDRRGHRSGVQVEIIDHLVGDIRPTHAVRMDIEMDPSIPKNYLSEMQYQFRASESALSGMGLREILLDEVVVEGRAEITEPFRLHRRADAVLTREQLPVAPSGNILESLQGRVAGLQIVPAGANQFRAVIRGQGSPLFLLDGVMVSESVVQSISQFDISKVEILKGPGTAGIYGGQAGGGVIALYTRRGGEDTEIDPESGKHIMTHRMGGFTKTRQFYVPKYEGATDGYYQFPDLRTTIHWNPQILMNSDASRQLSFFTADTPGIYRVIVQGISENGSPFYATHTFEVGE
ncbi:TonB-dependent receptor plug domain-containing protein [Lunatimonas sp.]|uniref:TonB-dependent receptor plug domain-containing protein n=1 Tax=Lunatimonas sp. TaxID=2060141 RepID=UPI00263AA8D9|nr:TonB-dependent receptor plug domain-containing protein [Lunatimonas sp.]